MTSASAATLNGINSQWSQLREFAYANKTLFEIGFIVVYAGEQATLILLTEFFPEYSTLTISLFALVVLTTFSFHKLLMESRIRLLEKHVQVIEDDLSRISQTAFADLDHDRVRMSEQKFLDSKN